MTVPCRREPMTDVLDLHDSEVEQILQHVAATADHYDDLFASEYGVPHASKA